MVIAGTYAEVEDVGLGVRARLLYCSEPRTPCSSRIRECNGASFAHKTGDNVASMPSEYATMPRDAWIYGAEAHAAPIPWTNTSHATSFAKTGSVDRPSRGRAVSIRTSVEGPVILTAVVIASLRLVAARNDQSARKTS